MRAIALFLLTALTAPAEQVTIQVLASTDLHGYVMPWDYYKARPAHWGLAKIATLIAAERRANPNTLLIDCGDTIQGSPLASVYQRDRKAGPEPMMRVMNALGYDAMVLGNHEFNYGLEALNEARSTARFPWISANTVAGSTAKPFAPYLVKTVGGIKVAVIGATTPAIPGWEKPENFAGYSWLRGREGIAQAFAKLEAADKPDLVIAAVHSGLERDLRTGAPLADSLPGENFVYDLAARVPGIDAIVFGHTHRELAQGYVSDRLLVQARNWGMSLAKLEFVFEREGTGPWKLLRKTSRTIPVTADVAPAPDVLAIAAPYHQAAEVWLNTKVSEAGVTLSAARARFEDTAVIDAIQQVQMHYSKADVSFASAFRTDVRIPAGPVTAREIAALYVYDNELYAVQGNGRIVREALENAARYYQTCPAPCSSGPRPDPRVFGFNYDVAQGVTYEIDVTRPPGDRIRNLRFRGEPLDDARPLRIAVNNYRAAGSAGYTMFRDARQVWRSYEDIRDLMVRYYSEGHSLPVKPDNNWRITTGSALAGQSAD
jgi:2',3'-cyclic-nucleotide 2'-phosphodiesterase/3'-nucleotidase